jgi:hypothetical protein
VILYELLTGRLPIPTEGLALHEAVRRVREDEPVAAGAVRRELRGDLETVLEKALAKEPARRYASGAEFADDLRLTLEGRPVRARRPTSLYVGLKLVRRHRALAATLAALFLALSAVQYGWFVLRQRERETERERRRNDFVENVFAHQRIRDELKDLEREGESILAVRPAAPERLEQWIARVEAEAAHLEEHRALLIATRTWAERENAGSVATTDQREYAVALLTDIVERLEAITGPRGDLALVRLQLAELQAATGRGSR